MAQRALGTELRLVVRPGSRYEPRARTTRWRPPGPATSSSPLTTETADIAAEMAAGAPEEESPRPVDGPAATAGGNVTAAVDAWDGVVPVGALAEASPPTAPADGPRTTGHGRTGSEAAHSRDEAALALDDVLLDGTVLTSPPPAPVGTVVGAMTQGQGAPEPGFGEAPGMTPVSLDSSGARRASDSVRPPGQATAPAHRRARTPAEAGAQGHDVFPPAEGRRSPYPPGTSSPLLLSASGAASAGRRDTADVDRTRGECVPETNGGRAPGTTSVSFDRVGTFETSDTGRSPVEPLEDPSPGTASQGKSPPLLLTASDALVDGGQPGTAAGARTGGQGVPEPEFSQALGTTSPSPGITDAWAEPLLGQPPARVELSADRPALTSPGEEARHGVDVRTSDGRPGSTPPPGAAPVAGDTVLRGPSGTSPTQPPGALRITSADDGQRSQRMEQPFQPLAHPTAAARHSERPDGLGPLQPVSAVRPAGEEPLPGSPDRPAPRPGREPAQQHRPLLRTSADTWERSDRPFRRSASHSMSPGAPAPAGVRPLHEAADRAPEVKSVGGPERRSGPTAPDAVELVREHVVPMLAERGLLRSSAEVEVRPAETGKPRQVTPTGTTDVLTTPARRTPHPFKAVSSAAPVVHLHIARIDVHPPAPAPAQPSAVPPAHRTRERVDLDAYLARRDKENR